MMAVKKKGVACKRSRLFLGSQPTLDEELRLVKQGYKYILGLDEAGRGPWAGPLVAACCGVSNSDLYTLQERLASLRPIINDSKKMTSQNREKIYRMIIEDEFVVPVKYAVSVIDVPELNQLGLACAAKKVLADAVNELVSKYRIDKSEAYLLIDAFPVLGVAIDQSPIIKGDAKCITIALASIIAKVTRDEIMTGIDARWPEYGFGQHKGYGTKKHLKALKEYGICPAHRTGYKPIIEIMKKEKGL
jgi:ribonuclease HII